jgi:hypothetical protein
MKSLTAYGERIFRRKPMQPDDLPTTSKDDLSSPKELSAEEYWAEQMKPSRQRKLTPSQRKELAEILWALRRHRFEATQEEWDDYEILLPAKPGARCFFDRELAPEFRDRVIAHELGSSHRF